MKFWDGEKYRTITDTLDVPQLVAAGLVMVDDDAPEPKATKAKLEKTAADAPDAKPLAEAKPRSK